MPIDENMLFQVIFAKSENKPIEQIMQEVVRAKYAYDKAEKELETAGMTSKPQVIEAAPEPEEQMEPRETVAQLRRLTRRSLKYDPDLAIGDQTITCCLCGAELKSISATHLRMHNTTPEAYRKACGYDPSRPLMANEYYKKMQATIAHAQKSRKVRKAATQAALVD